MFNLSVQRGKTIITPPLFGFVLGNRIHPLGTRSENTISNNWPSHSLFLAFRSKKKNSSEQALSNRKCPLIKPTKDFCRREQDSTPVTFSSGPRNVASASTGSSSFTVQLPLSELTQCPPQNVHVLPRSTDVELEQFRVDLGSRRCLEFPCESRFKEF